MKLPIDITFRAVPHSIWIEELVRKEAAKLDLFHDRIMKCQVVIDKPHRHRRGGNPYNIKIDITVPGEEIVVSREPSLHGVQQDVETEDWSKSSESNASRKRIDVAIKEAFNTARRLLQDHARRQRREVKSHIQEPRARVSQLFAEGYGLLATTDGREIYFNKSSVLKGGFKNLKIGSEVSFIEEQGEKGPQATTVKLLGRAQHA